MNEVKIENWNGHQIRFVDVDGKWYAVAIDICEALELKQVSRAISTLKGVTKSKVLSEGGVPVHVSEVIYRKFV